MSTDNGEIRLFLRTVFRGKPDELYILVWTLRDKRSRWFRSLDEGTAYVGSLSRHDVYVGVGLSSADLGTSRRCLSDQIAGLTGIWADFDLHSEAHPKALPSTIEDALGLIPTEFPPTMVVSTGNGLHGWWLFEEPWIFESDADRKEAAALVVRFQTLLRYKSSERGWSFDLLADLARVLRIPGTTNCKNESTPKPVVIHSQNDRRYHPSEFEDYLDALSIAGPEEQATKQSDLDAADQPLAIRFDAAIPDDLLARWMDQDERFRSTWNGTRTDMPDQSQSGYDMALADFGARATLTDQQIIDLIVHHRRLHGKGQCKTLDYYRRTISKARNKGDGADSTSKTDVRTMTVESSAAADTAAADPQNDSLRKAKLCDQLSRALGIRIVRLTKLTGKDPVYFMDLESGRLEFPNVSSLITLRAVKILVAAKTGKIIPQFPRRTWEPLAQMMLDACLIEEGTDDLSLEGAARMHIGQYLLDVGCISSLEQARFADLRKPLFYEGMITVSATDLQIYVNRTTSQNLSVKAVASMVASIGAKAVRVRQGRKDQSRWALPIEEFDPEDYVKDAPEDQKYGE